jgi:AcrR family transcriptional regulator
MGQQETAVRQQKTGLRERLVDVGVELVTSEGASAVSLREIARRAGVSHGAPRRYFPTHLDLLSAIARRGFADLDAIVDEAIACWRSGARCWTTCRPTAACTS